MPNQWSLIKWTFPRPYRQTLTFPGFFPAHFEQPTFVKNVWDILEKSQEKVSVYIFVESENLSEKSSAVNRHAATLRNFPTFCIEYLCMGYRTNSCETIYPGELLFESTYADWWS